MPLPIHSRFGTGPRIYSEITLTGLAGRGLQKKPPEGGLSRRMGEESNGTAQNQGGAGNIRLPET